MADATAVPPPPSLPRTSNRQARLDAAIAHFRSEASASGYVVEEVRLRLPVPDIDVLPRVVIAQNAAAAAAANAPPSFPHPKLPRFPTAAEQAHPRNPTPLPALGSLNALAEGAEALSKEKGFKRTVSGSVILNAISPARAAPQRNNGPTEPRGKFWNTVIAGEHRKAGAVAPSPRARNGSPASVGAGSNGAGAGSDTRMRDAERRYDAKKGSFRVSHGIPDSHVQLLLSSVAEMPPRTVDTSVSSSASQSASPATGALGSSAAPTPPPIRPAPKKSAYHRAGARTYARARGGGEPRAARPFRCMQCPSSFDREGHLRVHILAVHEKKRPFVCQVCDSAFGHSSSLLRHVRTVHQARRESDGGAGGVGHFRCSACSTAFSRVAQLNRHVATNHPLTSMLPTASTPSQSPSPGTEQKRPLVAHVRPKHRGEC